MRLSQTPVRLPPVVLERLRRDTPTVAEQVVAVIMTEVPAYGDAFQGRMGRIIENAVKVALDGFLDLAASPEGIAPGSQIQFVYDAAYDLGRGEARSGRAMDALASAYRIGARVAWRDMSASAARGDLPAETMAQFAELVFAYIDELSDASVRGHVDELASSGRLRQRRLERLCTKLLDAEPEDVLLAAAERAEWTPPPMLTAVLMPEGAGRELRPTLDDRTLLPGQDVPGLDPELTVLLVPVGGGRARQGLLRRLAGQAAVVGPPRPWLRARESYERAAQAIALDVSAGAVGPLDTEAHLVELVLGADAGALADLRSRVLAPLDDVSATSREKLTETLRAWLLHQGRRDEVAEALFVHPQTVRYRMGQLRELFGDALTDPRCVLELVIALGATHRGVVAPGAR